MTYKQFIDTRVTQSCNNGSVIACINITSIDVGIGVLRPNSVRCTLKPILPQDSVLLSWATLSITIGTIIKSKKIKALFTNIEYSRFMIIKSNALSELHQYRSYYVKDKGLTSTPATMHNL